MNKQMMNNYIYPRSMAEAYNIMKSHAGWLASWQLEFVEKILPKSTDSCYLRLLHPKAWSAQCPAGSYSSFFSRMSTKAHLHVKKSSSPLRERSIMNSTTSADPRAAVPRTSEPIAVQQLFTPVTNLYKC